MAHFTYIRGIQLSRLGALLGTLVPLGCSVSEKSTGESVSSAWHAPRIEPTAPTQIDWPSRLSVPPAILTTDPSSTRAIARVNGRAISHERLEQLLMRSRGLEVLEQLIGLEAAMHAAETKGLSVTTADVDREYDRALRKLADPLWSVTPSTFDRDRAEKLLRTVLIERKVSQEEFRLVMKRNAYLRKIVEAEMRFTTDQLRREFDRLYGDRARVRHIQLASLDDADRVQSALAAGEDFGDLAMRFSANALSASRGGLLGPISANDDAIPPLFRKVSFSLGPNNVSSPVRVGEWYHLIKLEEIIPAESVEFSEVRDDVERKLRDRTADETMLVMFENLFREASIDIFDPSLKAAFEHKRATQRQ